MKRISVLLVAFVLVFSVFTVVASADSFVDVEDVIVDLLPSKQLDKDGHVNAANCEVKYERDGSVTITITGSNPLLTVTWIDGTRLIEGVEYVLDTTKGSKHDGYTNNRRGPVAYANIVGLGDYAGTARGAFNISLQMDTSQSFDVQLH